MIIARWILLVSMLVGSAAAATDIDIVPDVVYGHKDGMALTFDVLKPKTGANGVGILFMVSGGWVSTWAPPQQAASRFEALLSKGFTVIPVRHGSSPKYLIPEIVADVRRVVRFVRYNAASWGIDPTRLGVYGGSAGGHLALMLGTASDNGDPNAAEPFLKSTDRVASVVAYFPPVDLREFVRGVNPPPNPDGTPQRFPALNFAKEKAPDYSPILHVSPDDPPTLLIHGDKDPLVPVDHSNRMQTAFEQNKVHSKKIIIEGGGHGFRGEDDKRAMAALVAWFEETLVNQPSAAPATSAQR